MNCTAIHDYINTKLRKGDIPNNYLFVTDNCEHCGKPVAHILADHGIWFNDKRILMLEDVDGLKTHSVISAYYHKFASPHLANKPYPKLMLDEDIMTDKKDGNIPFIITLIKLRKWYDIPVSILTGKFSLDDISSIPSRRGYTASLLALENGYDVMMDTRLTEQQKINFLLTTTNIATYRLLGAKIGFSGDHGMNIRPVTYLELYIALGCFSWWSFELAPIERYLNETEVAFPDGSTVSIKNCFEKEKNCWYHDMSIDSGTDLNLNQYFVG